MSKAPYSTRLQAGLGLIPETHRLLTLWEPGMGTTALRRAALVSGEFPNITARRLENIVVEAFAPRYLVDGARPARLLKALSASIPGSDLQQLMFLYTCRANRILADFVRERYWPHYAAGGVSMTKDEAVDFIRRAMDQGLTTTRWSDTTVERVSGYLPGVLADFGLLGPARLNTRPIQAFRPTPLLSSFLAHDLHVHGVGDQALLGHEDWRLFGLEHDDVLAELRQLALRGELILQSAGSLVRISWKHQTLEALTEVFSPLPSARLHNALTVTSGLKRWVAGRAVGLSGDKETIQTVVVLTEGTDYDTERNRLLEESRQRSAEQQVFLLGRMPQGAMDLAGQMYRCQRIVELHRNDPDAELKEYCASQTDRARRLATELEQLLGRELARGSFVFRGTLTAVDSLDQNLLEASKKHLAGVAAQVYDRFKEAPLRVETALTEKFLRAALSSLKSVNSQLDPLGLVKVTGGTPGIQTDFKALVSIRDHVARNGQVEGKRLLEIFGDPPFGWSPDTTRYLLAALFLAGEVKLRVGGREVTVNGQQAIDALKTNNSFKAVGVSLRDDRPSMEVLARAAQRLTTLSGEAVVPLEAQIGKAAQQLLPSLQNRYASLGERLAGLGLPGEDTMVSVGEQLKNLLLADCSEAPQVFGGESSGLFDGLTWAQQVSLALEQGLARTARRLQELRRDIAGLPDTGRCGC